MTPEDLAEYFRDKLGARVTDTKVAHGQLTVTVDPEALPTAARLCKEDPALRFDFFDWMSGVDERDAGFGVVTHLYSVEHRHHVNLRAVAPGGRDQPRLPSITGVYRGANWHEREAYDMFGVEFDGHPGLLPRILTVENFEGFPLRKEFHLSTRDAKPWPGAKEPEERTSAEAGQSVTTIDTPAPVSAEDKAAAAKAKAERAKAKAAAMRAKKAGERAAAEPQPAGGDLTGRAAAEPRPAGGDDQASAAAEGAAPAPASDTATMDAGGEGLDKPPAPSDPDLAGAGEMPEAASATDAPLQADEGEAEETRSASPAAAGEDVPAGTPAPDEPMGAAEIADSDIAKDAAAGAVQGDVAAGATGDQAGEDEPVDDLAAETASGIGAPPSASGTPGVEAEGRHGGATEQSGDRPAAETPGMNADPQGRAARPADQTPAPGADDGASATRDSGQAVSATMPDPAAPDTTPGGDASDRPVESYPSPDAEPLRAQELQADDADPPVEPTTPSGEGERS